MDETTMQYLRMVKDLESARLTCSEVMAGIDRKVAGLGQPASIEEPVRRQAPDTSVDAGGVATFGALMGALGWLFVAGPIMGDAGFSMDACFFALPALVLGGSVVGGLYGLHEAEEDRAKAQATFDAEYKRELARARRAQADDARRLRRERAQAAALKAERSRLSRKRGETSRLLAHVYDAGVVHPKYRTLPAICTFIDYFDTGICTGFSGPGGAYARYETEARMNRICTSLENIERKMDVVIANQYTLSRSIQETNGEISRLGQSIDRYADRCAKGMRDVTDAVTGMSDHVENVERSSAAAAWSAEQTRRELAYSRWVNNRYDFRRHL